MRCLLFSALSVQFSLPSDFIFSLDSSLPYIKRVFLVFFSFLPPSSSLQAWLLLTSIFALLISHQESPRRPLSPCQHGRRYAIGCIDLLSVQLGGACRGSRREINVEIIGSAGWYFDCCGDLKRPKHAGRNSLQSVYSELSWFKFTMAIDLKSRRIGESWST